MNKSTTTLELWFDGKIIQRSQAVIPLMSASAQFGLSPFEGIQSYWRETTNTHCVFKFWPHLARLKQSCKLLGIRLNFDLQDIEQAIIQLLKHLNLRCDIALRVIVFSLDEGSWSSPGEMTFAIAPLARPRHSDLNQYTSTLSTVSWSRISDLDMPPRIKVGANYINSRLGYLDARENGKELPLFLDTNGKVTESGGSCIFLVKDKKLITPDINSSILESIMKEDDP